MCLMLEDDFHLLFNCSYSNTIWRRLYPLLGLRLFRQPDWEVRIKFCVTQFTGNKSVGILRKLSFNACLYHIWGERNRRIFTQKSLSPEMLFQLICDDVRIKLSSVDSVMTDTNEHRWLATQWSLMPKFIIPKQIYTSWSKPGIGEVAVNTDGSLSDNGAGFGAIIRDELGNPSSAVAGSSTPGSITLHELQGVEAGLKLAIMKGCTKVLLRTDSKTVVSYLSRDNPKPPWKCHHVLEVIKRYRNQLQSCTAVHTLREANRAADLVSSYHPNGEFVELIPSSFVEDLKQIVKEDAEGKVYCRKC